eukprot:208555-Rhodomonas_salina.1
MCNTADAISHVCGFAVCGGLAGGRAPGGGRDRQRDQRGLDVQQSTGGHGMQCDDTHRCDAEACSCKTNLDCSQVCCRCVRASAACVLIPSLSHSPIGQNSCAHALPCTLKSHCQRTAGRQGIPCLLSPISCLSLSDKRRVSSCNARFAQHSWQRQRGDDKDRFALLFFLFCTIRSLMDPWRASKRKEDIAVWFAWFQPSLVKHLHVCSIHMARSAVKEIHALTTGKSYGKRFRPTLQCGITWRDAQEESSDEQFSLLCLINSHILPDLGCMAVTRLLKQVAKILRRPVRFLQSRFGDSIPCNWFLGSLSANSHRTLARLL